MNRRHSINFEYEVQVEKPMAYSKSEINTGYIEPLVFSFSDLFDGKTNSKQQDNNIGKNDDCNDVDNNVTDKSEALLDNLCNKVEQCTPVKISNKFNTDFYKLCSDTFLNESNYALAHPNGQNSQQNLSVDRFHISYQV